MRRRSRAGGGGGRVLGQLVAARRNGENGKRRNLSPGHPSESYHGGSDMGRVPESAWAVITTLKCWSAFLFLYFSILFFTKIYFCFRNLQKYTRPPRCRAAGVFLQKVSQKICARTPGGPVARQRGGRPPGRPAAGRPPPPPLNFGYIVASAARMMVNVRAVCTLQGAS